MESSRAPTFTELLGTLIRYFCGEVIVGSYGVSQYTGFGPSVPRKFRRDQCSGRAPLAVRIASAKSVGMDDAETPNISEPLSTRHLDVHATKNGSRA